MQKYLVYHCKFWLNDTQMEELPPYSKNHWNTRLPTSDVFHLFTQSIKFFQFFYRTDVWKTWFHQIDSKNELLFLSVIFTAKLGTRDFQNSPPFERTACFYVTISESFKCFQYFDFETNFLEIENLFQKTGEYLFLVETTEIENTSFPFKTAVRNQC